MQTTQDVETRRVSRASGLNGALRTPSDKSLSHRTVMFGSLAEGTSHVDGADAALVLGH